jgi:hypothetical protein
MLFKAEYDVRSVMPESGDDDFSTFHRSLWSIVCMASANDVPYARQLLTAKPDYVPVFKKLKPELIQQFGNATVAVFAPSLTSEARTYLKGEHQHLPIRTSSGNYELQKFVNRILMEYVVRVTEMHLKSPAAAFLSFGVSSEDASLLEKASVTQRRFVVRQGHVCLKPRVSTQILINPPSLPVEMLLH